MLYDTLVIPNWPLFEQNGFKSQKRYVHIRNHNLFMLLTVKSLID
jgi:hypothetical protein